MWDRKGRGFWLDPDLGDEIFDFLFNMAGAPFIEWIIYKGRMWVRGEGWQDARPRAPTTRTRSTRGTSTSATG